MALNARDLAPDSDYVVSSYSGNGNNCIKVARPAAGRAYVAVCDSKQTNGPAFAVRPQAWETFMTFVA